MIYIYLCVCFGAASGALQNDSDNITCLFQKKNHTSKHKCLESNISDSYYLKTGKAYKIVATYNNGSKSLDNLKS